MATDKAVDKRLLTFRDHLKNEAGCPADKVNASIAELCGIKPASVRNALGGSKLAEAHLIRMEERLIACVMKCICPPLWGGDVQGGKPDESTITLGAATTESFPNFIDPEVLKKHEEEKKRQQAGGNDKPPFVLNPPQRTRRKPLRWKLPAMDRLLSIFVKTKHMAWLLGFIPIGVGGWFVTFIPLWLFATNPVIAIVGTSLLTLGYCLLYFWGIFEWVKRHIPILLIVWTGFKDSPGFAEESRIRSLEGVPREFIKIENGRRRAELWGDVRLVLREKNERQFFGVLKEGLEAMDRGQSFADTLEKIKKLTVPKLEEADMMNNELWYTGDFGRLHEQEVNGLAEDPHPLEMSQYATPGMLDPKASFDNTLLMSPAFVRRRWGQIKSSIFKSKEEGLFWMGFGALVLFGTFMLIFGGDLIGGGTTVPPVAPTSPPGG